MQPAERTAQIARRQNTILLDILPRAENAVRQGIPADRFLRKEFHRHRHFGARDRRFFANAVFSWFRWKGWLEFARNLPVEQILAAAYRLDFPAGHPALISAPYPAPEPETAPPPPNKEPRLFLAHKAKECARLLGLLQPPPPDRLLPANSLPLFELPDNNPTAWDRLLAAYQIRPPVWIRVQNGFESPLEKELKNLGFVFQKDSRLPSAWTLPPEGENLRTLAARLPGAFEVQDIASQVVALVADPQPNESWWDLCAGSGGKTLHLADLAQGTLRLLATDIRAGALQEAKRRFARSPFGHTIQFEHQNVLHSSPFTKMFDGTLVDAPCSGSGLWGREPDARWRFSSRHLTDLIERQRALLDAAARSLRPGGRLVYATCSLFRAENTLTLFRFLERHPDFAFDPVIHPLDGTTTPGYFYIWPWEGPGDGFFIARLRKSGR